MLKVMKEEKGFSLVELIVAMFVASLVLTAIYSFLNMSLRSSSGIERRIIAQQDARGVLELMAAEIRMASFNPESLEGLWVNASACTGAAANPINRGIQEASADAIAVEMDITDPSDPDANGNGRIDAPSEIIKYNYDKANRRITRVTGNGTNCGGQQSLLGGNDDKAKTVSVENDAAGIPVFRYFNGAGTDISAIVATGSTDPTMGIPAIRRIEITLVVDTSSRDAGQQTPRRIIYSTSVIPRNHFTKLYTE